MHAVLIVAATLTALAGILFGTDHLDRRLEQRARRRGVPLPPLGRADDTRHRRSRLSARGAGAWARLGRACERRQHADRDGPEPVTHGRTAGPHGPIPIPSRGEPH